MVAKAFTVEREAAELNSQEAQGKYCCILKLFWIPDHAPARFIPPQKVFTIVTTFAK
jgi:hypothetical protein